MDTPEPTYSTRATESESNSDPYNASSYRNAERFYEANYGHFDSFEDAEYYYIKMIDKQVKRADIQTLLKKNQLGPAAKCDTQ